jgi:hypothetical protein
MGGKFGMGAAFDGVSLLPSAEGGLLSVSGLSFASPCFWAASWGRGSIVSRVPVKMVSPQVSGFRSGSCRGAVTWWALVTCRGQSVAVPALGKACAAPWLLL